VNHPEYRARGPVLSFLASLACRAPREALLGAFEEALRSSSPDQMVHLACRFGLASSLGAFVGGLPATLLRSEMRAFVIQGLHAEAQTRQQIQLLVELSAQPEVRGTDPIAIKGAALVLAGLTTAAERNFVDVDLLVAPAVIACWQAAAARIGAAFRPGRSSYEQGCVSRGSALLELHVALPGMACGELGPAYEEVLACSEPARFDSGVPGLRIPRPGVMREISVHHFLHHHGGEPAHALRALQDLACLLDLPEQAGLAWVHPGIPTVSREVAWLSGITRSLASGSHDDLLSQEFVSRLSSVAGAGSFQTFADEVDRWLMAAPEGPKGRARLFLRRLFPPTADLSAAPDESAWRIAVRRLARPWSLLGKYSRARFENLRDREKTTSAREWRAFLARSSGERG
jgi:Uncharacterised nucleotidyltransferase